MARATLPVVQPQTLDLSSQEPLRILPFFSWILHLFLSTVLLLHVGPEPGEHISEDTTEVQGG
ncbi:hypothetical protein RhiJN_05952 [Ceratobasidium sp. AG-Ba]|nr:hypothetical protein RhiJN_05952 [Ceratobasidium sp. AG-Ba]QRW06875.1 hypothetical protein RhiLY_05874 [Ceratobasidium sp. AG-Ba]